ncbi:PIN domain-containing protein [Ornithinimicrobium faecis]|uniref:PIN domain-containing protein n=1 Tax=Ornithinimicrobium faecis TaxID=2934158 RepID=A0ABY4YZ69_9MICO|nr:PIN domain-containing protein [Ornithinimicrobium sp. HY1793]USQ81417.1 PIN domain-containing protein [Ornithinimicrobium sp. HY1793]
MARTLVLDSEAVSAVAERRKGMAERLAAARVLDARVVLPSIVLVEVMTGSARDAAVWHVVNRVLVATLEETSAARAGALRSGGTSTRRKARDLTVDAIVAAAAIDHAPSVVLTADPADLTLLVQDHDVLVEPI